MSAYLTIIVSATTAIVVVVLGDWLKRTQEHELQQAQRLAAFSAAAWAAALHIGRVALADAHDKQELADRTDAEAADRLNTAHAVIRLLDPNPLYDSAATVDECLTGLLEEAREFDGTRQQWKDKQRVRLAEALETFELQARAAARCYAFAPQALDVEPIGDEPD